MNSVRAPAARIRRRTSAIEASMPTTTAIIVAHIATMKLWMVASVQLAFVK